MSTVSTVSTVSALSTVSKVSTVSTVSKVSTVSTVSAVSTVSTVSAVYSVVLPPSLMVFFSSIPSCKGKKTKLNLLFTYPYSFSNFKTYQLLECLFTLFPMKRVTVMTTQTMTGTRLARKNIVFTLNFLQGLDQGLPH